MDKAVYVLTKLPGVTEEVAKNLIAVGVVDIPTARDAPVEVLKKAGVKTSDLKKIKEFRKGE
jgi:hypothetical protein